MRSLFFNVLFYGLTAIFAILLALLSFLPGRKPLMLGLNAYTRSMVKIMQWVAGIRVHITGLENVPKHGPAIIAPKHQSYGDGIVLFSQFKDLSFVTGDHLEKFMTVKRILRKAGAVVIDNCGGSDARDKLQENAMKVHADGRKLLIYPEGHLSRIGTRHRYRKGIFFMYQDFNCPVVPVATNLGQRWNQNDWHKHKGEAHLEFLEPIQPGLEKDVFMRELEHRIETRSLELLDLNDLGHLNQDDIGLLAENEVARAKRISREAEEAPTGGSGA
ncbi:MAG: 1-acyl-sn-glycerol-3-phosphate acyltransferase [Acidimicrobiales bacterium]|nr:1-acyl-sn-glycerol-3-phosphate acyltransferase [Hyphomonadaceae bacterium]RZV44042.1 MAG: 1-acyl-sn-glycerol-3-phosphate acyltransferase [Acidimicrobiales bacterium]